MKRFTILLLALALAGCGDDSTTASPNTTATSNGTTAASNGTTATSNGTTSTSNGTTATSNGTTATSNGTTATSNGTTSASNGTGPEGTLITASSGGSVTANTALLEIPANALAEDTTITVVVEEPSEGAVVDIYDFGPDGLQFQTPATLTIDVGDTIPNEGDTFVLAVWEEAGWTALESRYNTETGIVAGAVEHFSRFSIIAVEDDGVVVVSECSDVVENFAACGGDLIGTWVTTQFCTLDEETENPFSGQCGENASYTVEALFEATATFDGTNVETSDVVFVSSVRVVLLPECIGFADCAEVEASFDNNETGVFPADYTCVPDGAMCTCTGEARQTVQPARTEPYTIDGNTLAIGAAPANDYCISGDAFLLFLPASAQNTDSVFVYERQ